MSLGRGYLKMLRTKKEATSEVKEPVLHEETGVNPDSVGQLHES